MRFTKLGENDIRCIISEAELINFGLNLDDIIERNSRTKEFFRHILDMGSRELGMGDKKGIHLASAQISVLKDKSISVIFHETSVDEVLKSLAGDDVEQAERLKRDIDNAIKKNPHRLTKEIRNEIVDVMENKIKREGNLTPAVMAEIRQIREEIEKDDANFFAYQDRYKMCAIRFDNLDDAIKYSLATDIPEGFSSSLYKAKKEEEFYMIISRNEMPLEAYSSLLFGASEFGSVMELTDAGKAFLVSNSEVMIEEEAGKKLRSMME